jgi:hypothetical protein
MNRAKDLDIIAPDDNEPQSSQSQEPTPSSKTTDTDSSADVKQRVYTILGHTTSPFSSFIVCPDIFDFSERNDGEEILLAMRPHWFTNISWILTTIGMLFVPLIFQALRLLDFLPLKYQFISLLFWFLVTFIFAFEKFLSWYFDVYMITDERVVDIDFNNMLNKKFAEADLSMIQDVSSTVTGVAGTLFNYGNVLIQTASEVNQIIFEKIPNPEKVIRVLQELREADQDEHKGENQ